MIKFIKYTLYKESSRIANKFGYHLLNDSQMNSLASFSSHLMKLADDNLFEHTIDSIVFSKDRAMQLHAFLSSYIEMVENKGKMYILYTFSDERHQKSYNNLIEQFQSEHFIFIKETHFRDQLIDILAKSKSNKIIFYVDDMIFTRRIDYNLFKTIDTTTAILSLSRGKDMDYSMVLKKKLTLPPFLTLGNNLMQFSWNYLNGYSDWTYPLGVSGYMYSRVEIYSICKAINFKAPNSLESAMQLFLPYFINRYGICTEFASCICIHANLVQTEGKNPVIGKFSIEQLLTLWEKGKRIDLREFYNKPMTIAQIQDYSFV